MESPLKSKNRPAILSSNTTLRDISKGMRLRLLQRHLHTHVYCSTTHNSQAMETAKTPTTDKWIKKMWYLYTMEFYSATQKNEILLFASKWMEQKNIIFFWLRRPKIACSSSYADYRPKTNAVILLNMCHTLRGESAWEK
jgi:hypothetical protein